MFFGNLFVYFQFQGKTHIDLETRQIIFGALISVAIVGVIFLAALRRTALQPLAVVAANDDYMEKSGQTTEAATDSDQESMLGAFKTAIRLFFTKEMLLLSVTFLYTGIMMSMSIYIYGLRF